MYLSKEEMLSWVESHVVFGERLEVLKNDCEIIEFMLDRGEMYVPDQNRFFVKVDCADIPNVVIRKRRKSLGDLVPPSLREGMDVLAYTGSYDYSHTTAEWESVIKLGIYGLRNRVSEYAESNSANEGAKDFYEQILRVYNAALRFMKRAADTAALCGKTEMSEALLRLTNHAPSNLFEALQTSIV